MFYGATYFNQPIGNWNTSLVENMNTMFKSATNFNQNISFWKLKDSSVILTDMFLNSGITTQNYNGTSEIGKLYGFTVPTPSYNEFNQNIGLNSYSPIAIERGTTYSDAGAILATGISNLTVDISSVDTNSIGTYNVTYNATKYADSTTVTRTRTVIVVDTINPTITNSLNTSINDGVTALGSVSADETVTWSVETTNDGSYVQVDSSGTVSLKTASNYQTKPSYTYTIKATDSAGNENTVTKTVSVVDTTAPTITNNLVASINDGVTALGVYPQMNQ
jgi:Mycoplasma protein of unknown function, DUF285.